MRTKQVKKGSMWHYTALITTLLCAIVFLGCAGEDNSKNTETINTSIEANDKSFVPELFVIGPDEEGKIYSDATLKDDFAPDRVAVVLNQAASLKFKTYTPEDFPEIDCIMVVDTSTAAMENVKLQLEAYKTGDNSKIQKYIDSGMLLSIGDFRQILTLHLSVKSKENVLQAIRLLEKRPDIFCAEPDYVMSLIIPY